MATKQQMLFDYFAVVGVGDDAARLPLANSPFPNYPQVTDADRAHHWEQVSQEIVDIKLVSPSHGERTPEGFTMLNLTPSGDSANLNTGMLKSQSLFLCVKRAGNVRKQNTQSMAKEIMDNPDMPIVDLEVVTGRQGVSPVNVDTMSPEGFTILKKTVNGHNANLCKGSFSLRQAFIRFKRFDPTGIADLLSDQPDLTFKQQRSLSRENLVVTDIVVINASKGEHVPPGYTALETDANRHNWHGASRMRLCVKRAPTLLPRMLDTPFAPVLLDRAPTRDPSDREPLPPSLESFCAPMGLRAIWCRASQAPPPLISHFVLTDTHRNFSFGTSLIVYEPMSRTCCEKVVNDHRNFRARLSFRELEAVASSTSSKAVASSTSSKAVASSTSSKAVASSTSSKAVASSTSSKAVASSTSNKAVASSTSNKAVASSTSNKAEVLNTNHLRGSSLTSPPSEGASIYVPKCLCLISRQPFFNSTKECLLQLLRIEVSQVGLHVNQSVAQQLPKVEFFINGLMNSVPRPLPHVGTLQLKLGAKVIEFSNQISTNLPSGQLDIAMVLGQVSTRMISTLVRLMLLEQKILLVSSSANLLVQTAEVARSLIFPFEWQSVYIPVCPEKYLGVLEAPMAFLVGTQVPLRNEAAAAVSGTAFNGSNMIPKDRLPPSTVPFPTVMDDVWVLDLDRGEVVEPRVQEPCLIASEFPPTAELVLQIGLAQVRECLGVSSTFRDERPKSDTRTGPLRNSVPGIDRIQSASNALVNGITSGTRKRSESNVDDVADTQSGDTDLLFKTPMWEEHNIGEVTRTNSLKWSSRRRKGKCKPSMNRAGTGRINAHDDSENVEIAYELFRDTGIRMFALIMKDYQLYLTPPNPVHAHWILDNQDNMRNAFTNPASHQGTSVSKAGLDTMKLRNASKETEQKFVSPFEIQSLFDKEGFLRNERSTSGAVDGLATFLRQFVETQHFMQFIQSRTYSVLNCLSPRYQYFDYALEICNTEGSNMGSISLLIEEWFSTCEWVGMSSRSRSNSLRGDAQCQFAFVDLDSHAMLLSNQWQEARSTEASTAQVSDQPVTLNQHFEGFPALDVSRLEAKLQGSDERLKDDIASNIECGPACRSWVDLPAAFRTLVSAGVRTGPEGASDDHYTQRVYGIRTQSKEWAKYNMQCIMSLWITLAPYAVYRDLASVDAAFDVFLRYQDVCPQEQGDQTAVRAMLAVCVFQLSMESRERETWIALRAQRVYEKLISWGLVPDPLTYGIFSSLVSVMELKTKAEFPLLKPAPKRRSTETSKTSDSVKRVPLLMRSNSAPFVQNEPNGGQDTVLVSQQDCGGTGLRPPSPSVQVGGVETPSRQLARSPSSRGLDPTETPETPIPLHKMGKQVFLHVLSETNASGTGASFTHPGEGAQNEISNIWSSNEGRSDEPACVILWTITACHECGETVGELDVMGGWIPDASDYSVKCTGCGRGVLPQLRVACVFESSAKPMETSPGVESFHFDGECGTPLTVLLWEREYMCPIVVRKLLERSMGEMFGDGKGEVRGMQNLVHSNPSLYWNMVYHFARIQLPMSVLHHDWINTSGPNVRGLKGSKVWAVWDGMTIIRESFPKLYTILQAEKQYRESHAMHGLHGLQRVQRYFGTLEPAVAEKWEEIRGHLVRGEVRRAIEIYLRTRLAHGQDEAWSSFFHSMYSAFVAMYSTHEDQMTGVAYANSSHSTVLEQRLMSTIGWVGKDLIDELKPSDYPPKRHSLFFQQVFGSTWC